MKNFHLPLTEQTYPISRRRPNACAPERAESVIRAKLHRGERLMGFGHRIYRVRDPRADVLAQAAERFYSTGGDRHLYQLARSVEAAALRLLRERKPLRRLDTNVEFYTALLLHGLGLAPELFTATFAVGRALGWTAHCLEQLREGGLIRPHSLDLRSAICDRAPFEAFRGIRGAARWAHRACTRATALPVGYPPA
jgi:citrate synthase